MLLTRSINSSLVTSIVLQDVLVIATDQTVNEEGNRPKLARTATHEVDPTDASKLVLAQQVGKLSLSLRGVNGSAEAVGEPIGIEDLPARPEYIPRLPEPEPAPVEVVNSVRVLKGAVIEDVPVR